MHVLKHFLQRDVDFDISSSAMEAVEDERPAAESRVRANLLQLSTF